MSKEINNFDYIPKTKPQAIFFDFDGVILESATIKTDAFVELFNHLSKEYQEEIHKYHIDNMGISRFKKFEWIYETLLSKDISEDESIILGKKFSNIVLQKIIACPFVSGAQDLLEWSKTPIMNFVASGTPQKELREIVNLRNLNNYFENILGSPDSKTTIVNNMVKEYGLDKKRCWFIGDANTDYHAAMETGLNFIARNTAEMESFWKNKDIWLVDDLHEVKEEFSKLA